MSKPTESSLISRFSQKLFLTTTITMVVVAVLSLAATVVHFNNGLKPYLIDKAEAVASAVRQDIEYALSIGIPFDEIRGLDQHIAQLVSEHPEISDLEVITTQGSDARMAMASRTDITATDAGYGLLDIGADMMTSLTDILETVTGTGSGQEQVGVQILQDGNPIAQVVARIDDAYLNTKMTSVFFDTLVILIAVSLVALEIVVVFANSQLAEPFRRAEIALRRRSEGDFRDNQTGGDTGRIACFIAKLNQQNAQLREKFTDVMSTSIDSARTASLAAFAERTKLNVKEAQQPASIMDARIPLFIFCFAEELQKSFLPLFVAENHSETDLFARDIMMGLPISAFMFVIAAFTPFAGKLVDKFGNKALFLAGVIPAIGGYLTCYLATSGNEILFGRALTAVGYAVITISSQSYIAAVVSAENRARGMAIFVGVLMTATMCGTAVGAILADWMGYKRVFLVATVFALIAGLMGWRMLSTKLPEAAPAKVAPSGQSRNPIAILMRNTQFVLIVLFCAIPAKVILTGFLYLFVPIYLASLDATQSEIGRVMMLYSLIIIPISPIASGFADRIGQNLWMVIVATIASGIVLIALYQSASVAMVLAVVAALGVVHAFLKAPLIVAAIEAAENSPDITRTGTLSILRTSERIGSVIGPVVVASLLAVLDYSDVAVIIGITVAILGVIMALVSLRQGRGAAHV